MTKKKRSKRPGNQITRSSQDIGFADARTKDVSFFRRKDFEAELKKIYAAITAALPSIRKLGDYELKDIELSVGVSGDFVVVTVEGGITLRYSL
jgi:hypothetical protein